MSIAELNTAYGGHAADGPPDDRVPPQDLNAEQSVLGSMLINKDAIADSLEVVKAHDFYRPAHELIFDAILDLFGRYATQVQGWIAVSDLVALMCRLSVDGQAVRSAVSRMTRRDLLRPEVREGVRGYATTERADELFAEAARERGALTIGFTGKDGGRLLGVCDEALVVPSDATERIQEGHITVIHLLCDLVERMLFGDLQTPGTN